MKMVKFVCVFLSLLLAVLSNVSGVVEDGPPDFVYRADFRDPASIFLTGMKSWGKCQNIYFHVKGGKKTSAFVSTSSSEGAAKQIAGVLLNDNKKKSSIYVYKIRATDSFYSAYDSLTEAAEKYYNKGKGKKAQKYMDLAKGYRWQWEWMAYREIPPALIQLATAYTLQNPTGTVVNNPSYVQASTYGNGDPFPESTTGCSLLEKMQAKALGR